MAAHPTYINPIAAFFASYPSFRYQSAAESSAFEFDRLCKHMKWGMGDPAQKAAWNDFQAAVAKLFNGAYGTDADSLEAWQKLCRRLKISPVPNTLEGAREAVFNTHVNLLDLAEAHLHPNRKLTIWTTEAGLAEYTLGTRRIVSASNPMAGGLLKALLRHIFHPPGGHLMRDHFGNYVRGRRGKGSAGRGKKKTSAHTTKKKKSTVKR